MMKIRKTPACKPFTPNNFLDDVYKYCRDYGFEPELNLEIHSYANLLTDYFEIVDFDYDAEIDFSNNSPFYECILEPNRDGYISKLLVQLQFAEIF